jgi:hypothetical protein
MTMDKATYKYYVDWNNDGDFSDANEDISAYVLSSSWERGSDSPAPGQAKAGTCRLKLDNSTSIFSPNNASSPLTSLVLPGRRVKVTMAIGLGAPVTMWAGYLETIDPTVGDVVGVSTADLTAYGVLAQLTDAKVDLAMQTDILTGDAVDAVLDAASFPAGDRTIDSGQSKLSRFWASGSSALDLLRQLEAAEVGMLGEGKNGDLIFEDRGHRFQSPHDTVQATYGTGTLRPWNLRQINSLPGIFNSVEARVRTFQKSEDMVLATLVDVANGEGGAAIPISAGETKTIWIEVPGPDSSPDCLAVDTWGIVTYEVNTAADGSGTDITNTSPGGVAAVRTEYGSRLKLDFTNNNAVAGYFVVLRANGLAVVEGDPIPVKADDATSQTKYRKRSFPDPSQWITNVNEGQVYCNYIRDRYKDPRTRLGFELRANYNAAHLAEAKRLDISDRIHITASLADFGLAIDDNFYVESLQHSVDEGGIHTVQVVCSVVYSHSWTWVFVSSAPRTLRPYGAPDDLRGYGVANGLTIAAGIVGWKWNRYVAEAEFRAKRLPAGTSATTADLRTPEEGGTLVHDGIGQIITTGITGIVQIISSATLGLSGRGFNRQWVSASAGRWFFCGRLKGRSWSVWSDGNNTPSDVTDYVDTNDRADIGPPADWTVRCESGPGNTVIVKATRPLVNGSTIFFAAAQIKLISESSQITYLGLGGLPSSQPRYLGQSFTDANWHEVDDDTGAAHTIYDGAAIAHVFNQDAGTLTLAAGDYGAAAEGDLLIMDVRGGAFAIEWCEWGTIPAGAISGGVITGMSGFRPLASADLSDMRIRIVRGPWMWDTEGYLGAYPGSGIANLSFWENKPAGDAVTQEFVFPPIPLPPGATIDQIAGRVWFENPVSRSDDETYSAEEPTVISESWQLTANGGVNLGAPTSAPSDPDLLHRNGVGSFSIYLDEAGNKLKFRVVYSDGKTFKDGEIALS